MAKKAETALFEIKPIEMGTSPCGSWGTAP